MWITYLPRYVFGKLPNQHSIVRWDKIRQLPLLLYIITSGFTSSSHRFTRTRINPSLTNMPEEIGLTELRLGDPPRDSKIELNPRASCEVPLEGPQEYPHGYHFALISASLMISVFLLGLVRL
jgi:hypothetical protein